MLNAKNKDENQSAQIYSLLSICFKIGDMTTLAISTNFTFRASPRSCVGRLLSAKITDPENKGFLGIGFNIGLVCRKPDFLHFFNLSKKIRTGIILVKKCNFT